MEMEEPPLDEISAQPSGVTIVKNVFGAILIFILAGVMDWIMLIPAMQRSFAGAILSHSVTDWMLAGMSSIIVLFVIAFPAYLIFRGLANILLPERNLNNLQKS